mmetsp:Transcript_10757/g.35635  ORF Transcript_10757/g.35635 Transcript_10757/m.35635 type:complete len:325 (+) Transcript_10757:41-1015(+)
MMMIFAWGLLFIALPPPRTRLVLKGPQRASTPLFSDEESPPPKEAPPPPQEEQGPRLNKCLPSLSRRAADAAIREGRVTVNGALFQQPAYRCQPGDVVALDGVPQRAKEEVAYLKYWKPRGVECTAAPSSSSSSSSEEGLGYGKKKEEDTVGGAFASFEPRVFYVGRLDKKSTGLLLLTSDGHFADAVLRPKSRKAKVYRVRLDRRPSEDDLNALRGGVVITTFSPRAAGGRGPPRFERTRPCLVERLADPREIRMTLEEGRNRQIRRMCAQRGLSVEALHRISFAGVTLEGLKGPGDWKPLSSAERDTLLQGKDATLDDDLLL